MSDYSQLIQQISALGARVDSPDVFVARAVNSLADSFDVIRVALSIRPTTGGPVASHEARSANADKSKPRFVFSRKISVRDVEYGRLDVESSHPVRDAVIALETISRLIGQYAEQRRLAEANAALANELQALEKALSTSKLMARAAGLIANQLNIPRAAAEKWIAQEAARTSRSLHEIADRVVLNQQAQHLSRTA